jgi:hypothetical protein
LVRASSAFWAIWSCSGVPGHGMAVIQRLVALFDQQPPHDLSFGPGLVRLQAHAENLARLLAHFIQ